MLGPLRNKALLSVLKMLFTFYTSKYGIALCLLVASFKIVFLFYALFVSAYDISESKLRLYLYIILWINCISVAINALRFRSCYRNNTRLDIQESIMYIDSDSLVIMINLTIALFVPMFIRDIGKQLENSNVLYCTLVYIIIYDQCVYMLISLFISLFVLIATSMKRRKNSFILKRDDTNRKQFSSCPICLENYQYEEFLMVLYCGHNFHYECVSIWLDINNSCPVCKKDLDVSITLYEDESLKL